MKFIMKNGIQMPRTQFLEAFTRTYSIEYVITRTLVIFVLTILHYMMGPRASMRSVIESRLERVNRRNLKFINLNTH
jgi:hypothetical protein